MEKEKTLVENLIARLEPSPHGKGFVWKGIVTEQEVSALRRLAGLQEPTENTEAESARVTAPLVVAVPALDVKCLSARIDHDLMLCVDFGTAFSKAAATDPKHELVEIALGKESGERNQPFFVQSTLYVSDERIWFGPQAIDRSRQDNDPRRKRFDSPKQEMSQGNLDTLSKQLVEEAVNPSAQRFSKGDLIQLYLAFLTDLTCTQLENSGYMDVAPRRYARPCWEQERATLANKAFRDMLLRGQVIADTLHGSWAEGIPVIVARKILDQAIGLKVDSARMVDRDVLEATAAASAALKEVKGQSLFLIVDIGAGTSDFGLFFAVAGRRIAQISSTTQVLRQAGNHVDSLVFKALLDDAHVDTNAEEGKRIALDLSERIRDVKEAFFRNGAIAVALANDSEAQINLSEFQQRPDVRKFVLDFEATLQRCLCAPALGTYERTNHTVKVVLTGGSSSLPIIRQVFARPFRAGQHGELAFDLRDSSPEWLADYPNFIPIFPQMAVAIGGAQPDLPEDAAPVTDVVPPSRAPLYVEPTYKS